MQEKEFWDSMIPVPESGCWIWERATDNNGYGNVQFNGKLTRCHRVSWELTYGKIPDKMLVCHTCDTPSCANPKHLFLGTHSDNGKDSVKKKRNWSPHGETHPRAKLTGKDIKEIRASEYGCKILARKYNTPSQNICLIRNHKTWKEI